MQRFKERVDLLSPAFDAARRRIRDRDFETISDKEADSLAARFLSSPDTGARPTIIGNSLISSVAFRRYWKDAKFLINILNSQLQVLGSNIDLGRRENFSTVNDIQQEALALSSTVTEQEIKLHGSYDYVHYNEFTRPRDLALGQESEEFIVDPKTGVPFLRENFSTVVPNVGITMPVREMVPVSVSRVDLVSDETDFGDSLKPLATTPAMYCVLPGKVFRHTIVKKEFDSVGRKIRQAAARCTLLLTLGGTQMVNHILIKPLDQSGLVVAGVSYVDDSGADIELDIVAIDSSANLTLITKPVRTRWLKISFETKTPITKTLVEVTDNKIRDINGLLTGAGFSTTINEPSESVQGRVYDFAIESIELSLNIYQSLGIYRSKPLEVRSPTGAALTVSGSSVEVGDSRAYGVDNTGPQGVLQEAYIGVDLKDSGGSRVLYGLAPIPDYSDEQIEYLPVVGRSSGVKLFPDLRAELSLVEIQYCIHISTTATIRTVTAHGLLVSDVVGFIGPASHLLNGEYTVVSVDSDYQFTLTLPVTSHQINAYDLPKTYLYKVSAATAPFDVYADSDLLVLGTDYSLSLDHGATFYDELPLSGEYNALYSRPVAGACRVQITLPKANKLYWVQYKYLRDQNLNHDGTIKLSSGRLVFEGLPNKTKGNLTTVLISRTRRSNPYLTTLVASYSLRVRSNVS